MKSSTQFKNHWALHQGKAGVSDVTQCNPAARLWVEPCWNLSRPHHNPPFSMIQWVLSSKAHVVAYSVHAKLHQT